MTDPMRSSDAAGVVAAAMTSRRTFLRIGALAGAAAVISVSPIFPSWLRAAQAATPDLIHDTYNGLIAFVVPGSDPYSVAQGVSTADPGGIDTGIIDVLIGTIDESAPYLPQFSAVVAGILNNLAQAVHPGISGAFAAPFACLAFPEKVAVLEIMDGTDALKFLSGVLPGIVAFLCYSDAGSFDPSTRSLTGHPVGWSLSSYSGAADGRDEFRGYFGGRTSAACDGTCAQGEP